MGEMKSEFVRKARSEIHLRDRHIGKDMSRRSGLGSSVGVATDYGLDGPGSNPGRDEIFRPSRPALGPTQPRVKWVPVLSRGQSAAGACY